MPSRPANLPESTALPREAQAVPAGVVEATNDDRAVWQATLARLRTITRRSVVDAWFDKVIVHAASADGFVLEVPDEHFRDVIALQHLAPLRRAIEANGLGQPPIELRVAEDLGSQEAEAELSAPIATAHLAVHAAYAADPLFAADPRFANATVAEAVDVGNTLEASSSLVARFTFGNFVEGESNQLALSAARTVAEHPGETVNPVFLYGGVGLGKTHLLHAIGNAIAARRPNLRVRYVPAETFADDTIAAMRSRDASVRVDVRAFYRNVDVLLLDDVQFLQGKAATQEEFFHTFNALYLAGKQIVLTCDRFPTELHDFHERLRSRFENGLTAGISPPDRDLRVAILRQRAAQHAANSQASAAQQSHNAQQPDGGVNAQNHHVPLDVIYYLADHLRNNVRELEGALHKLYAHARLGKRPIDLALARAALGPIIELPSRHLTVEVIQRVTAQHYGLRVTDLKGAKRHRGVVVPRMVAVWLTRKHTQASFPEIGRSFGGRDHSTAIHACQKIDWLVQTDPAVQAAIQAIETALGK